MNEYYHSFVVGFNFWYLLVPALMFLIFAIGTSRYALSKNDLKIRKKMESKFYLKLISILFTFLSCLLMAFESMAGFFQLLENSLGDSDILWLPLIISVVTIILVLFLYELFYACGRIGMWVAYGYLSELQEELETYRRRRILKLDREKQAQREREFKMINLKPLYERLDPDFVEVIPPSYNF